MSDNTQKLLELIKSSQRILVSSHISPDPDAVSSLLIFGTTIARNFPSKDLKMVLEEKTEGLDSLYGYSGIEFQLLDEAIEEFKPELIVLVDGLRNIDRFSRHGGDAIRQFIHQTGAKLAVIDHHKKDMVDEADVFINDGYVANVQQVYEVLFKEMNLTKPTDYAKTTLLGLYSDSGGFIYNDKYHKETLSLVSQLLDEGASLESIATQINAYTDDHLLVLAELMKNASGGKDYSYTYLVDDFVEDWLAAGRSDEVIRSACGHFANDYLRNIDGRQWGFIVRPDLTEGKGYYAASFRSVSGVKDVSILAQSLGGGGHTASAGAKNLKGKNVDEVVSLIRKTIEADK